MQDPLVLVVGGSRLPSHRELLRTFESQRVHVDDVESYKNRPAGLTDHRKMVIVVQSQHRHNGAECDWPDCLPVPAEPAPITPHRERAALSRRNHVANRTLFGIFLIELLQDTQSSSILAVPACPCREGME